MIQVQGGMNTLSETFIGDQHITAQCQGRLVFALILLPYVSAFL